MALITFSATLPAARVRGDVNGDGAVTAEDAELITTYLAGDTTLDDVQLWCSDVNDSASVTLADVQQINRFASGLTSRLTRLADATFADYYGNWTYVAETALTGYWYIDVVAADVESGMTAKALGYTVEAQSGSVRIKTTALPPVSSETITVSAGYSPDWLITDRTQADVNYAAQLNRLGLAGMSAAQLDEWLAGLKGSYNASDLNRVGQACAELYGLITGYGYAVPGYVALSTSWTRSDIPTQAQMATYLNTVAALHDVYYQYGTQPPEDMEGLTYAEANAIEQCLVDVYEALENMAKAFVYSGQVYSGMVWGWFTTNHSGGDTY